MISGLHAPADALAQLASVGLIADAAASGSSTAPEYLAPSAEAATRYSVLYALMCDAVREHLGLRGYFM
ncbi:hypothetical protein [Lysobacter sp. Root494]|uniref:hypothetical protein n=1 Tax=Lysobacter sp. Root494 TaxID=1736549 RepID=UPI000AC56888|nr:hypothetical protein [Lysobacter sp. Root494]